MEIWIYLLPTATSLRMDGRCNDRAYHDIGPLPLAPYESGGNASAFFLRRGDDLWVCLSGLDRKDGLVSEAGLYIDVNGSRDAGVQSDDFLFRLGEDGSPQALLGNGSSVFGSIADVDFDAQVAATETAWTAEFRIPSTSLALWQSRHQPMVRASTCSTTSMRSTRPWQLTQLTPDWT